MLCKHILLMTFLDMLEFFFCTQLKSFMYYNVTNNLTSVIYLHTFKWMYVYDL